MSLTALQLANQRLQAIRKQQGVKVACVRVDPTVTPTPTEEKISKIMAINETMANLPSHLGYGSQALSQHLRRIAPDVLEEPSATAVALKPVADIAKNDDTAVEYVRAHASIVCAIHKAELDPCGRVWLLLRHIDQQGRGWLHVEDVRARMCAETADLRISKEDTSPSNAWRSLRGIFQKGEGIFWERDDVGRIFLSGAHKLAHELGLTRLWGKPINIPINKLLGGIRQVRASFFASFLESRKDTTSPISRATLEDVTGFSRVTQTRYESEAGITKTKNIYVSEVDSSEKRKQAYYERGHATFILNDVNGDCGKPNTLRIAHQLPNSYKTPLASAPRGRKNAINQYLARKYGDNPCDESRATNDDLPEFKRIYYRNAKQYQRDWQWNDKKGSKYLSDKPPTWRKPVNVWFSYQL